MAPSKRSTLRVFLFILTISGALCAVITNQTDRERESIDPTERESIDPAEGESIDPAETESIDPAEGESIDPAERESIDSAETESIDPAEGESIDPAEGESIDPAETESNYTTERESIDPAETESNYTTERESIDSAETKSIDPAEGESIDPAEGESIDSAERESNYTIKRESIDAAWREIPKPYIEALNQHMIYLFESTKEAATKIHKLEELKNSIPCELKQKVGTDINLASLEAAADNIKNATDALPTDLIIFKAHADILIKNIDEEIFKTENITMKFTLITDDLGDSVESLSRALDKEFKDYNTVINVYQLHILKERAAQLKVDLETVPEDSDVQEIKTAATKLSMDIDSLIKFVESASSSKADAIETIKHAASEIYGLEGLKNAIPSELKQLVGTYINFELLEAAAFDIKKAVKALPTDMKKIIACANTLVKNINEHIGKNRFERMSSLQIDRYLSDPVQSLLEAIDEEIKVYHPVQLEKLEKSADELDGILNTASEASNVVKIQTAITELNTNIDSAIRNFQKPSSSTADVIRAIEAVDNDLNKIAELSGSNSTNN